MEVLIFVMIAKKEKDTGTGGKRLWKLAKIGMKTIID